MDSPPIDLPSGSRGHGGDRLSTMMRKFRKLDKKRNHLYSKIQLEINRLQQPSMEEEIISFVRTVEKAHHYFDFKEILRDNSPKPEYFTDGLENKEALYLLPKKLNLHALSQANITAAIRMRIRSHFVPKHLSPLNQLERADPYAFSNPVFRVVFLSRMLEYDMDLCPERELQKIKDSSEDYCNGVIFADLVSMPSKKDVGAASHAKWLADTFEEACNKYNELLSRRSKDVKAGGRAKSGKASEDRGTTNRKRERAESKSKQEC